MDYALYLMGVMILVPLGYLSYRVVHLINLVERNTYAPDKFMCYYCHSWFPMSDLDQQGNYTYCPKHGKARGQCLSS